MIANRTKFWATRYVGEQRQRIIDRVVMLYNRRAKYSKKQIESRRSPRSQEECDELLHLLVAVSQKQFSAFKAWTFFHEIYPQRTKGSVERFLWYQSRVPKDDPYAQYRSPPIIPPKATGKKKKKKWPTTK